MGRPGRTAAAAVLAAATLAGCSGAPPSPTATPPTPAASTSPTASAPQPTSTPTPQPALAACPTTAAAAAGLPVIWRGGAPDDLAVAADGALWIGDVTAQVIRRVVAGSVTRTLRGLAEPEGIVPLAGGDVVVAEQGRQRVTVVHADDSRSVLLTLPAAGSQLGVDGIAFDPRSGRILVPDSPHGTLQSVALSGPSNATTLATGLGRVVGVTPDTTGSGIWLAAEEEAPRGLRRLDPGATPATTTVGNLVQLDDVVLAAGVLYATDLRNRSVHAVDPRTGASRVVASGFGEPQGLAVLPDGGIAVADSPRGVVQRIEPCAP